MDSWQRFLFENADLLGGREPGNFVYSCNISLKYRYIYLETPKVACSTIKLTLQRAELENPNFLPSDFEDIHRRDFSPLLKPTQIGSFREALASGEFFCFCFVRNPFTRLLSCYLDKIARPTPMRKSVLEQLGRSDEPGNPNVSFEEFVAAVRAQPAMAMDPHWALQTLLLLHGKMRYDFVGRFETFDDDMAEILQRLAIPHQYYFRERRNETRAETLTAKFYDDRSIAAVREIYAADFAAFGYDREPPP
jgi:hypothetical protein